MQLESSNHNNAHNQDKEAPRNKSKQDTMEYNYNTIKI